MDTRNGAAADQIFRVTGGLGSAERVERHFFGRAAERQDLVRLLEERDGSDDRPGLGVLVVAGRRMGKTALWEWLKHRFCPRGNRIKGRLGIAIDWQDLPQGLSDARLLEFFFHRASSSLSECGVPLERLRGPVGKMDDARRVFREFCAHLKKIHEETGRAPLLLLDETQQLVKCDHPDFILLTEIKRCIADGLLCLVATTYPHGTGRACSLNILNSDSGSPVHKLFDHSLRLSAWSPEDTWTFLQTGLDALGVEIPDSLRDDVLRLTQGIPWIVNQLGLDLSRGHGDQRSLVTDAHWRWARERTLNAIRAQLMDEVRSVADRDDRDQASLTLGGALSEEQRLGNGRLWSALRDLAANLAQGCNSLPVGESRHGEACFHIDELHEIIGHPIELGRLHRVLNEFTDTNLLSGDDRDASRFYFANNLMPVLVQFERICDEY